jgi:uncharacterized membrane protein
VHVIGIKTQSYDNGIFVLEALKTAVREKRVALDDIALVHRDEGGKIKIVQTEDTTTGGAAGKGMLVGALVGLAAPPLLGAAAVGAGLGAIWGKFRDRGVDDDLMKRVGKMLSEDEAVVFAMGSDASIQAVGEKVREIAGDSMETFMIGDDDESLVREAADEVPDALGPQQMIRVPYS